MTATISIDTILNMLSPLNYDSKKWLADRLYDDIRAESRVERMKERLSELSLLRQGWDGGNAMPIDIRTCYNMQAVLNACNNEDVERWVLFPDVNGSLYLDFKSEDVDAGIILSAKSFSYFTDEKEDKDIPFALDIFLDVLRSINGLAHER